jgi:16S rRNA A1518/A1519 N6-dimethyltransferase RsmA/KsgA/DIM1 with predicted DNA glycosylase/AP lyase activity
MKNKKLFWIGVMTGVYNDGDTILDVGSGDGFMIDGFKEEGADPYGIELRKEYKERSGMSEFSISRTIFDDFITHDFSNESHQQFDILVSNITTEIPLELVHKFMLKVGQHR